MHEVAFGDKSITEQDLPSMINSDHVVHCIDLLRQSLMCRPDTTIEVIDDVIGGVLSFGTRHERRDWNQLVAWTARWE